MKAKLFRGRLSLWIAVLAIGGMLLNVQCAQANDFLEKQHHYSCMSKGTGKFHFKLPVYSRGGFNYLVQDNERHHSEVYLLIGTERRTLFFYCSDNSSSSPQTDDKKLYGYAYIQSSGDVGVIEITNSYNGQRQVHVSDGVKHQYSTKKTRESDNDDDYVTWLEIDWYPPVSMNDATFDIGTEMSINKRVGDPRLEMYHKNWTLVTNASGRNNLISAQLLDPFFYAVNESGVAGYGCAAVPYTLFYEPVEYHTSFNANSIKTSERSGNLFVPTTDSVQSGFNATYYLFRQGILCYASTNDTRSGHPCLPSSV